MSEKETVQIPDKDIEVHTLASMESCNFCLCDDNLEYVRINATATVSSSYFEINSVNIVKCDHAFGGEFTSYHHYVFDQKNAIRLYQSLGESLDLVIITKLIKRKFGSNEGLLKLDDYCKERTIEYLYTYRSVE